MPEYGKQKAELDILTKSCKKLNSDIKSAMEEGELSEYAGADYTVKISVSTSDKMNEDKLLYILSQKYRETAETLGIIKVKEYVDFDAMEKAIYNGEVSEDMIHDIGSCNETKETVRLLISKKKGGE